MLIVSMVGVLTGAGCSATNTDLWPTPYTVRETDSTLLEKEAPVRLTDFNSLKPLTNPVQLKGEARGNWFFEASFPVKMLDANGIEIGSGIAQANGDWMTENFVPFTASVVFAPQAAGTHGTLVLQKDNPSGLPANDDSLSIPVTF